MWVFSRFVIALVVALFDASENAFSAPFADVALGCGLGDVEAGSQLFEGLCGERSGKAGEELLFALDAFGCGLGELGAGEFLVHADGVLDEDVGDGHRGGKVFVVTEEGGAQLAGVMAAEGCEDHCDAESDKAQTTRWL